MGTKIKIIIYKIKLLYKLYFKKIKSVRKTAKKLGIKQKQNAQFDIDILTGKRVNDE